MGLIICHYIQRDREIQQILYNNYHEADQWLNLRQCQKWEQVLKYRDWTDLRELSFRKCTLDASSLRSITIMHWPSLTKLDLVGNQIGSSGAKLLNKTRFPQLRQLFLYECGMGRQGRHLVKGNWPHLETMDVKTNWMGQDGYYSIYCIYSHCLSYVAIAENNAIGALALFAAINWHIDEESSTYAEVCFIMNKTMHGHILSIFGSRLRKPSWMI